ncbi:uncharacterized protein FIBRA_02627 [Fibroporia radiculosa]|uniref:Uncharacterized protein n=1 Tax=Fibroporia radiculosa TaxID=599839 RepID=J4I959_9APHY|nr:uncharacterized protein FIBRA_02627 [Fibroporia radiculosa]CCM00591.1 predicted protein [Fibroporia radiculosa]
MPFQVRGRILFLQDAKSARNNDKHATARGLNAEDSTRPVRAKNPTDGVVKRNADSVTRQKHSTLTNKQKRHVHINPHKLSHMGRFKAKLLGGVDRAHVSISRYRKGFQDSEAKTGISWYPVRVPANLPGESADQFSLPGRPCVWASNKKELCEIIPELSRETNGVVWRCIESPVLFLENDAWVHNLWEGKKIEITMIRELIAPSQQPEASPQNHLINSDSMDGTQQLPEFPTDGSRDASLPNACAHAFAVAHSDNHLRPSIYDMDNPSLYRIASSPDSDNGSLNSVHLPMVSQIIPPSNTSDHERDSTTSPLPQDVLARAKRGELPLNPPITHDNVEVYNLDADYLRTDRAKKTSATSVFKREAQSVGLYEFQPPQSDYYPDNVPVNSLTSSSNIRSHFSLAAQAPPNPAIDRGPDANIHGLSTDNPRHSEKGRGQDPRPLSAEVGVTGNKEDPAPAMPSPVAQGDDSDSQMNGAKRLALPLAEDEWPEEIKALTKSYKAKVPVSVLLCGNSPFVPYTFDPKYGVLYMGFFCIKDIDGPTEQETGDPLGSSQLCWRFKLEWTPGQVFDGSSTDRLRNPWWMPYRSNGTDTEMITHPFSLLPLHLLAPSATSEADFEHDTSELTLTCGCADNTSNGFPPIGVDYVRNHNITAPIAWPWDRPSRGIVFDMMDCEDGSRIFSYQFQKDISVRHLFTCNSDKLQEEPSRLFRDLQIEVEMTWRKSIDNLAIGSCYAYFAGRNFEHKEGAASWTQVPQCILKARELLQNRCASDEGTVNWMILLAWVKPGSKSGCFMPARHERLAILCLGADVELCIFAKSLSPEGAGKLVQTLVPQLPAADSHSEMVEEDVAMQASSIGGTGLIDAGHLQVADLQPVHPLDNNQAFIGISAPVAENGEPKSHGEHVFVTLVHGDTLILEGDDFEFTLKKTGMSIVLLGCT